MDPLTVTLAMDDILFARVNGLRQAHFPPERNFLLAHLTLFHKLPGEELELISTHLREICRTVSPFELHLPKLRFLGKGVAIDIVAPPLSALRLDLSRQWQHWLTPQDRQPMSPHITIQNKVAPAMARALFTELSATWVPLTGRATGLLCWWYRGGPWELAGQHAFGNCD